MKNQTAGDRVVLKFRLLSDKYHKLSLLFNELASSINLEIKARGIENSQKKLNEYLKTYDIDFDKLKVLSKDMSNISLEVLKKEK